MLYNPIDLDDEEISYILNQIEKRDKFNQTYEIDELNEKYKNYIEKLINNEKKEKKKLSFDITKLYNEILDLQYIVKKLENEKVNLEHKKQIEIKLNNEEIKKLKYNDEYTKTKMKNDYEITLKQLENDRNKRLNKLKLIYENMNIEMDNIKSQKDIKEINYKKDKIKLNLDFIKESEEIDNGLLDIKLSKKIVKKFEELKTIELNNKRILETEGINNEEKFK